MQINGKNIPPVAIGTWGWGSGFNGSQMIFGEKTDESAFCESFRVAYENGFILFDTAAVYGMGTAEKILAECARDKQIVLSDKYTPGRFFRAAAIEKMLSGSLERLEGRTPDIYFLHWPFCPERNLEYLCQLVADGRIASIGVSNFNVRQVNEAAEQLDRHGLRLGGVQNHYSLIFRGSERDGVLDFCRQNSIPFFSYMVLEQGALSGKYTGENPFPAFSRRGLAFPKRTLRKLAPLHALLAEIGQAHGLTAAETAITYAITKGTVPIVGITKPYQAKALCHIKDVVLSPEEVLRLEDTAQATGVEKKGIWEPRIGKKAPRN